MNDDPAAGHTPDDPGEQPEEPTAPIPADSGAQPEEPTAPIPAVGPPVEPQPGPVEYARQDLLPQQVQPSRSHTGLYIAIAVGVVLVLVGVAVFLVVSGGGGDREAYCNKLRDVTHNGDLTQAFQDGSPSDLRDLADLAPSPVSDDWDKVISLVQSAQGGGQPPVQDVLQALSSLQAIAADAKSECDISIDLPLLGQ